MAQVMDYVAYLAKEIGPRPAGTEEEQQAALYITEQFQKETGFAANIEEFSSSSNFDGGRTVLSLVIIVATILAIIFPILVIPSFVLAAAAAAIYTLEAFDRPIISRVLSHGASQNVVAKYQPNYEESDEQGGRGRSRKIVLVAHYDTGRVTPALVKRAYSTSLPLPLVCTAAMILSAFFLLIRIFIAPGGGMGLLVLNILSILCLIVCLLPIVKVLLMRSAPYNEGANNNATGSAALIEVARRISRGRISEADLAQNADSDLYIHGEAAAREAGLIPEGVQIRYEAERLTPPSELGAYDEEERLLAAKAAIAALTGKPVERRVYGSVADKLVNSRVDEADPEFVDPTNIEGPSAAPGAPSYAASAATPAADGSPDGQQGVAVDGFENAPSWFVAAQQNAKRSNDEPAQVQRSKYTEAMEQADRARADREEELRAVEQAQQEAELRAREQEARAALMASAAASSSPAEPADPAAPSDAPAPSGLAAVPQPASPGAATPAPETTPAAELAGAAAPAPQAEPLPTIADEPDAVTAHPPVTRERITHLPSIEPSTPAQAASERPTTPTPVNSPSRSGMLRKLRTNVPSLSGLITPINVNQQARQKETAASRSPKPSVADSQRDQSQRVAVAVPDVEKAPAPALEPVDYDMEVPRSRAGNLLKNIRGGNADNLSGTPQEWLDVEEDFDARTAGRERGSWESFRDDQHFDDDSFDDFGTGDKPRRRWNGGAYSRMQLGHVNMRSGHESEADSLIPEELPEAEVDRSLTGEIEQIYHFRNPQFNTEIWFVAMGADGEGHDGARAFLEAHADELRGSMIIEIESLGFGALSVATEEGRVRKVTASSRVKRYTRRAVSATGIALDDVSLAGADSIASIAQKSGYQSMHIFGAENGLPALKGSSDDVVENLDELLLDDHVNFIFELLKQ